MLHPSHQILHRSQLEEKVEKPVLASYHHGRLSLATTMMVNPKGQLNFTVAVYWTIIIMVEYHTLKLDDPLPTD